jgi:hypothetical protein
VLHLDVSLYKKLCCTCMCLSTRAFVLHLDVSVYKRLCCTSAPVCAAPGLAALVCVCLQEILCCTWTYLFTRACATPVSAVTRELVLHLDVSFYKRLCCTCLSTTDFVLHLDVSVYKKLCCTCMCLSTRAFVLHLDVSIYKSLCCTCKCLSVCS